MSTRYHVKKILHYSAGRMFNNIILVIFLPIFSHYMVPEQYAVYTNITIFISLANIFYSLGFTQSLVSYFYLENTDDYKYTLINSVYIVTAIVGIILSLLIYISKNNIALLILKSDMYSNLFPAIVIIIIAQSFSGITLSIINKLERSLNYAILGGVSNFLILILFIYGAISGNFSISNVISYIFISSLIAMLAALININIILRSFVLQNKVIFSYEIIKPVIRFGLIMIPGTLALISMRVLDRYMLTYLSPRGLYDVGIYAMGYKVGAIMQFLLSIVSMVFFPHAMKNADSPYAGKLFNKIYLFFLICGAILGFFIIIFSKELFAIFVDAQYTSAADLVFFGAISTFLHGIFNIFNLVFYKMHQAGKIAIAVVLGTIINIGLNIALIPKYGAFGAGYASIISYILIVIFNYVKGKKTFNANFRISYVYLVTAFLFLTSFLNSIIRISILVSSIKITVILVGTLLLTYSQKQHLISFQNQFRSED